MAPWGVKAAEGEPCGHPWAARGGVVPDDRRDAAGEAAAPDDRPGAAEAMACAPNAAEEAEAEEAEVPVRRRRARWP